MKLFKGFNRDLQCTPDGKTYQYEIGKQYEEATADLCGSGFHACEDPMNVLDYYCPADGSRYCEVEMDEMTEQRDGDTKRVGKKIRIGVELKLRGLIEAGIRYVFEKTESTGNKTATTGNEAHAATTGYMAHAATTGNMAHAATTGNMAHAATTGYMAHAATTGNMAHAATTGYMAHAATTGYMAHAATTGYMAHAATTGNEAHAATTGNMAHAATTGNMAHAATTGNMAHAEVKGADSIAAALGIDSRAMASIGSYIVLAEWRRDIDGAWHVVDVKAAKVDGVVLMPDISYALKDGEFVEVSP